MYAVQTLGLTKRFPKLRRYREMLLHPFRREEITALQGVDLSINPGELFGILGPNGAGKTTLIKILATLILPDAGQALVAGWDVVEHSRKVRSRIGLVVNEERSFYWRLTGRQNLEFFAALNNLPPREAERRIQQVLELTDLLPQADKMFKDYSTGMRQRLAIARGLLTDPEILFLDEPTRSLDPVSAEHLRSFVAEELVRRRGKTVLLATHNLLEADICHRLALLDQGQVRICGTLSQIKKLASPNRYILHLAEDRIPEEKLRRLAGLLRFERIPEADDWGRKAYVVEFDPQQITPHELVAGLVQQGVRIFSLRPEEMSLGEIFLRLTRKERSCPAV